MNKIYKNKITKKLSNNLRVYYGSGSINVKDKIEDIFKTKGFKNVSLKTSKGILNKTLVGKNDNYLLTSSNELIKIDDVIDISLK